MEKENLIKKLIYRSKYRGCKETDILLGNFAEQYIHLMTDKELLELEILLDQPDQDIMNWVTKKDEVPAKFMGEVMTKLLNFPLAKAISDKII